MTEPARRTSLIHAAALLAIMPALAAAQAPSTTAADSARLHVAAMQVMFDSLAPDAREGRTIWLVLNAPRPGADSTPQLEPSDEHWRGVFASYPAARRAGANDTLFLCPPGISVRLPGRGCPIRDEGIMVHLHVPEVDGDSATVWGWLTRSHRGSGQTVTWAEGMALVFDRDGLGWRLRAVRARLIT